MYMYSTLYTCIICQVRLVTYVTRYITHATLHSYTRVYVNGIHVIIVYIPGGLYV